MSLKIKKVLDNKSDDARKPVKLILLGDSAVDENDQEVNLDIWDTAGQERFSTMHPAYYHEAHACVLVFDVTRKTTYKNMEKWLGELRKYSEHIPCIVACNKIDTDPSVVTKTFAFAEKHNLPLHYVSAADGTNVVQLFEAGITEAVKYKRSPKNEDFMSQVLGFIKEGERKDEAATAAPPASS